MKRGRIAGDTPEPPARGCAPCTPFSEIWIMKRGRIAGDTPEPPARGCAPCTPFSEILVLITIGTNETPPAKFCPAHRAFFIQGFEPFDATKNLSQFLDSHPPHS